MSKKTALILEGGANRGIYTAGVLDYLMEQNFHSDYVIGVSAGACNAIDYVSWQPYRSHDCILAWNKESKRDQFKNFCVEHSIMDMKLLFEKLPNIQYPFDYETFFSSETACELCVTNALTGKAEYLSEKEDPKRLMQICQASCSLPILSNSVKIDGIPFFDGGVADSIPVLHARKLGYEKIIVVLTQKKNYRKTTSRKTIAMLKAGYPQYPELVRSLALRANHYNTSLTHIDKWEQAGKLFVIRPETEPIKRLEKNADKLQAFYDHGYQQMEKYFNNLTDYLQRP